MRARRRLDLPAAQLAARSLGRSLGPPQPESPQDQSSKGAHLARSSGGGQIGRKLSGGRIVAQSREQLGGGEGAVSICLIGSVCLAGAAWPNAGLVCRLAALQPYFLAALVPVGQPGRPAARLEQSCSVFG